MSVRWHARELTVKWRQEPIMGSWWRSTDRLLSPMCTYCVLGYLLLEPHWSPPPPPTHTHTHTHGHTHPPTERSILSSPISEENFTSWQWCLPIFSTKVNLVKQDGPRIYKYWRYILARENSSFSLDIGYIQHIAIELQNEDISKLTETRTNRGSERNVELLPTIEKNGANNEVWH